jgi:predicted regulator of amino acid metabolism with ACT domain
MRNCILILLLLLLIIGCKKRFKEGLTVQDIEIFRNTVAWDLVQSVDRNDVSKIQKILKKNPKLANFQDPVFGTTALMRAVSLEKYQPIQILLENGADPNIISKTGTTALFRAISFSWDDTQATEDPKYVKILLDYKADPNINYCSPRIEGQTDPLECGTSPLIHSVSRGLEKTKLLVNAGADINYKTKSGNTAAYEALLMKDVGTAHFLIVEHKAKIAEPVYSYSLNHADTIDTSKPHYPVDLLLDWIFELNSVEYQKKRKIIAEFNRQGVDYENRKKNISNLILRRIKKMHPNDWEEYIKEY